MKIVHIFFVRLKHYLITELRFLISLKLRSSIVKVNFDSISFKLYTNSIFSWIRAKKIKNGKAEKALIDWGSRVEKGSSVLDVGSNFGLLSIYLAKKKINVISVEPDLSNYLLLIQNINLNNINEFIKTFPIAINKKGIKFSKLFYVTLHQAFDSINEQTSGRGDSTLFDEKNDDIHKNSYTVASLDLLSLIENQSNEITYIKIDIEDSIYLILNELKMLIERKTIKSFYIELSKKKKFLNLNNDLLKHAGEYKYEVSSSFSGATSTDYTFNRMIENY